MFYLSCLRGIQLNLVLGKNLQDGTKLQPPLCSGDAVPVGKRERSWAFQDTPKNNQKSLVGAIQRPIVVQPMESLEAQLIPWLWHNRSFCKMAQPWGVFSNHFCIIIFSEVLGLLTDILWIADYRDCRCRFWLTYWPEFTTQRRHLLKIGLLFEFGEGLEYKGPSAHAQEASWIRAVGKDTTWKKKPLGNAHQIHYLEKWGLSVFIV